MNRILRYIKDLSQSCFDSSIKEKRPLCFAKKRVLNYEHCIDAQEMRQIYGADKLIASNGTKLTGNGMDIYIVTAAFVFENSMADTSLFCKTYLPNLDFKSLNISVMPKKNGFISQNNSQTYIDLANVWRDELGMDIQSIITLAPKARIWIIDTIGTDLDSLTDALTEIDFHASNNPNKFGIVSMSLGTTEGRDFYTHNLRTAMESPNLLCFVASGDNGITPIGKECDFPACVPGAISVGGTHVRRNGKQNLDYVWKGSGGGVSMYIAENPEIADVITQFNPEHYNKVNKIYNKGKYLRPRITPDICADAAVESGFKICINGEMFGEGGTSLATPLTAAYFALVYESISISAACSKTGNKIPKFCNTLEMRILLYKAPPSCFNIVQSEPVELKPTNPNDKFKELSKKFSMYYSLNNLVVYPSENSLYKNTTGRGEIMSYDMLNYLLYQTKK